MLNTASAALLVAAEEAGRLEWAARMVGLDVRTASRVVWAWRGNRGAKQMARRLEPQVRRVSA